MVSKSSVKIEYKTMAHIICELAWTKHLFVELNFPHLGPMELKCDYQTTTYISSNLVFHERTKHIGLDCHFISEKI